MATIQWIYANGCSWVCLDMRGQEQIEKLWSKHHSDWIDCRTFPGGAFVDFSVMELQFNGYSYAIARRRG